MRRAVTLFLFLLLAVPAHAEEIVVAAASDLGFAIQEIIEGFEATTPHRVRLSLGSSGNFFTQIRNGAPFDVYLSADIAYPRGLAPFGLVEPDSIFVYAVGRIVVWVRNESTLDVESLGPNSLLEGNGKVSIANPRHAPYGRAAMAAIEHYQFGEHLSDRLVLGENVAQAAQFVQSGAAEIGIIALSLAESDPMREAGRFWEIPLDAYPRMDQGGVILAHAGQTGRLRAARAFTAWMQGPEARGVLRDYGLSPSSN